MVTSVETTEEGGAEAAMAAAVPVGVCKVTEGSVGRAGTGLTIFKGTKALEAQCSRRYSPPFSS